MITLMVYHTINHTITVKFWGCAVLAVRRFGLAPFRPASFRSRRFGRAVLARAVSGVSLSHTLYTTPTEKLRVNLAENQTTHIIRPCEFSLLQDFDKVGSDLKKDRIFPLFLQTFADFFSRTFVLSLSFI